MEDWVNDKESKANDDLSLDTKQTDASEALRIDLTGDSKKPLVSGFVVPDPKLLGWSLESTALWQNPMESGLEQGRSIKAFREEYSGSLFLIGGNKTDEAFDQIVSIFAGLDRATSQPPKVSVIGSAAKDDPLAAEKIARGFAANGVRKEDITILVPRIEKLDDASAFRQSHDVASDTDIAYFGGGYQDVLVKKVDEAQLRQIAQLLKDGKLVVGSSAGAAVMADEMIADGDEVNLVHMPGLGLMPWAVIETHVADRNREPRALTALYEIAQEQMPVVGMDRDTGVRLFWDHGKLYGKVYGKGVAHIVQPIAFPELRLTPPGKTTTSPDSAGKVEGVERAKLTDPEHPDRRGNVWRLKKGCTFELYIPDNEKPQAL